MGTGMVLLCAMLGCATTDSQVDRVKILSDSSKSNDRINLLRTIDHQYNQDHHEKQEMVWNSGPNRVEEIKEEGPVLTNLQSINGELNEQEKKMIFKRAVKKSKTNTKRRKKFNKKEIEKKMQQNRENAESETKSKSSKSKSEETEESETVPDSDTSEWSSDASQSEDSSDASESESSDYDDDDSEDDSHSDSDDKTDTTEEVSLTPENTEEIYSGPDSSPPASSDSTDESSASKAIKGGSSETSEISYTMSSSAEDAFGVTSSSESSESKSKKKGGDKSKDKSKNTSKSKDKPKTDSKSEEKSKRKSSVKKPKVTTKIKNKKGKKKITVDISLNKNSKSDKGTLKMAGKDEVHDFKAKETGLKMNAKENISKMKLKVKEQGSQHLSVTTETVLNMVKNIFKTNEKVSSNSINKLKAEQKESNVGMKEVGVKQKNSNDIEMKLEPDIKANNVIGKKLQNEVKSSKAGEKKLEDKGQIEWTTEREIKVVENQIKPHKMVQEAVSQHSSSNQGRGAAASKERRGMELLKVKKAIDPKKKTDLETELIKDYPQGTVEIVNWEGTFAPIHGEPYVAHVDHQTNEETSSEYKKRREAIEAKTKDKGKKEKKKPKLSKKEKKKKKQEKAEQEKPNNFARSPGKLKVSGVQNKGNMENDLHMQPHIDANSPKQNVQPHIAVNSPKLNKNTKLNVQPIPSPAKLHAAEKSGENLKTPSEEERESGTTYKPEGAYEYPSFRHPDFNPDTAYDENGIPIHESPGWTQPPTLPGDRRFGKERSRAGAGLSNRVKGPLAVPQVARIHKMEPKVSSELNNAHKEGVHGNVQNMHTQEVEKSMHSIHVMHPAQSEVLHQPLGPNYMAQRNTQNSQDIHAHLAAQEHQHAVEALRSALLEPAKHTDPNEHGGIPVILPAQHQGAPIRDNVVKHKIQKRRAAVSGSMESALSSVINTRELRRTDRRHKELEHNDREDLKEYKAYKLTDSELMNKEDSAPLEALNPALFMQRNMMHVKKKKLLKNQLDKLPNSAEVIAVFVSPKDGCHFSNNFQPRPAIPKKPVVYNKYNENLNPLLYKHRNMFKVSDLKDDGLKINKEDVVKQLLQKKTQQGNMRPIPLEEYVNGPKNLPLKGRGRENFNPIFINPNNMFHVKTNKFNPDSVEHHAVRKREINEALNPALYSYQNIFGNNPKQVLPFKGNMVKEKANERSPLPLSRFALFGRGVPVIDNDSEEENLDPQVKQFMGKNKEALNPYLMNFPNMFKVDNSAPPRQHESSKKTNRALDPSVNKFIGRNKENLNPFIYQYPNMFSVNSGVKPEKVEKGSDASNPNLIHMTNIFGANSDWLHKMQLQKRKINPMMFANKEDAANGPLRTEYSNKQLLNDKSQPGAALESGRAKRQIDKIYHQFSDTLKSHHHKKREAKDGVSKEAIRSRI